MPWIGKAVGRSVVSGDWVSSGHLRHIDPYLVWFDVTGFRGAALLAGGRLPMIEELRSPPGFRTRLRSVDELRLLLAHHFGPDSEVLRFEISPGIATVGDAADAPATRLKNHRDSIALRRGTAGRIVGFIDYGCAFAHRKFRRDALGSGTRVLALWDQSKLVSAVPGPGQLQWRTPPDFCYGGETHRDAHWFAASQPALRLDDYIVRHARDGYVDEAACYRDSGYEAVARRQATHGTHIMDVATGHPDPLRRLKANAPAGGAARHAADIVFVQLPRQVAGSQIGGLLRSHVYDGLQYIASCAPADARVVVNLSYGGYAGPHDGSTVLERAVDDFLRAQQAGGRCFDLVIPAGNAREMRLHARAELQPGATATFQWNNLPDDPTDSFVEIWLPRRSAIAIRITGPGSTEPSRWLHPGSACSLMRSDQAADDLPVAALVFARQACQSDAGTMALLAVGHTRLGSGPAAPYGAWRIEVRNRAAEAVTVHAWCERDEPALGSLDPPRQPFFSDGVGVDVGRTSEGRGPGVDPDSTLNSIGHGEMPIVVGGRAANGPVAAYSGTGPGRGAPPGSRARTRQPAAASVHRRGPEDLAISDESVMLPGVAAAALLGTEHVRLNGTSVAAAVVTRRLLEGRYDRRQPKTQIDNGEPVPAPVLRPRPGPDPHPDSDLLAQREPRP